MKEIAEGNEPTRVAEGNEPTTLTGYASLRARQERNWQTISDNPKDSISGFCVIYFPFSASCRTCTPSRPSHHETHTAHDGVPALDFRQQVIFHLKKVSLSIIFYIQKVTCNTCMYNFFQHSYQMIILQHNFYDTYNFYA